MTCVITLCLVLLKESLIGSKLGAQETLDPLASHPKCWGCRGHMGFCTDFEDLNPVLDVYTVSILII